MKPARKPTRRSLDDALRIVEAGIVKIVAELHKPGDEGKSTRPRRARSKSLPQPAA